MAFSILLPDELESDASPAPVLPDELDLIEFCCTHECESGAACQEKKLEWQSASRTSIEKNGEVFRQIRASLQFAAHCEGRTQLPYLYFDQQVCRTAFLHLWEISSSVVDRLRKAAKNGLVEPPPDGRTNRPVRPDQQRASQVANDFWLWIYDKVAEYLAEGVPISLNR